MMTMGGKAFVDTNVLLRARQDKVQHHQEAKSLITKMLNDDVELWISRQIIREYLVQITHPNTFSIPLTIDEILEDINTMLSLYIVADETQQTTEQLLQLLKEYPTIGKQIHDANIVATMLVHGIDTLLTINIDDMKRFGNRISLISPLTTP